MEAVVVQWSPRGFGFLETSDSRRAYVHTSKINGGGDLKEGEMVTCEIVDHDQKPGKFAAVNVTRYRAVMSDPASALRSDDCVAATVAQWTERGFGFLDLIDGRRAYVHSTSFGGGNLLVGEEVGAIVVEDDKNPGKWAAKQVMRYSGQMGEAGGTASIQPLPQFQQHQQQEYQQQSMGGDYGSDRVVCTVANWNTKGFGFLEVADGRRAYVHVSQCGGTDLTEGESVMARLVEDAQNAGKLAAQNVQRVPSMGRMNGVVVEWSERGFGFIEVDDGRRVYVHSSSFGGGNLARGDMVNFSAKEDERNPGKWAAKDVHKVSNNASPVYGRDNRPPLGAPAMVGAAYATAQLQPAARQYNPVPQTFSSGPIMPPDSDSGQYLATTYMVSAVAEWHTKGGFGFLDVSDGRRAYVHVSTFGGGDLEPGEVVSALIAQDMKNPAKWQAVNLKRDGGVFAETLPDDGRLQGIVSKWDDRGFGFIELVDGRNAYVHSSFFGGGDLVPGQAVSALIIMDQKNQGKWAARELHLVAPQGTPAADAIAQAVAAAAPRNEGLAFSDMGQDSMPVVGTNFNSTTMPWTPGTASFPSGNAGYSAGAPSANSPAAARQGPDLSEGSVLDWANGVGVVQLMDGRFVYAYGATVGVLNVGEAVTVLVGHDSTDPSKLVAKAVQKSRPGIEGTIVEWISEMGCGTIALDNGKQAHVGKDACEGNHLSVGQRLRVMVEEPDGILRVSRVLGFAGSSAQSSAPQGVQEPDLKRPRVGVPPWNTGMI